MDAVLRPSMWASPAPPVGGGSLAPDTLQLWSLAGDIKSSGWIYSKIMEGVHHPHVQTLGEGIWSHTH